MSKRSFSKTCWRMWSAWISYPQFRTKDNQVNTFAMRIQGCFRFSMNGTPPPAESEIIVALQSYAYFLARGAPTGVKLEGAGFPMLAEPEQDHGAGGIGGRTRHPPARGPTPITACAAARAAARCPLGSRR